MTAWVIPAVHTPLLEQLAALLPERGTHGWLVGGYVRDLLRGVPGSDLDIVVDGPAITLAREFADQTGGAFVLLDETTDAARIVFPVAAEQPLVLDLVRLRAPTITEDLQLRDFTINALAVSLKRATASGFTDEQLIDVTNARADLVAGRIRMCGPTALSDDPLRLLRAVRFAAQLGFAIDGATDAAIRRYAALIDEVARERVRDELLKLLAAAQAAPYLRYLDDVRLLTRIIPELEAARDCAQPSQHFLPVLDHLLETVAAAEWLLARLGGERPENNVAETLTDQDLRLPMAARRYPQLTAELEDPSLLRERMAQTMLGGQPRSVFFKVAALLHDVGKPQTKQVRPDGRITFYGHPEVGAELVAQIGQRLHVGREATGYLQLIVREHMRPGQLRSLGPNLTRRAIYRFWRDTDPAAPDVLLHAMCDHLAARGPLLSLEDWEQHVAWTGTVLRESWRATETQRSTRLITGTDIMRELQIAPGPLIGRALAAVAEAQFLGEVQTRAEALALAANIVRGDASSLIEE